MKRIKKALFCIILVSVIIAGSSLSMLASAETSSNKANGWYVISPGYATNMAIDIPNSNTANGVRPILYARDNSKYNQQFYLSRQADGTYTMENRATGKMLDASLENYYIFQQYQKNGGENQKWYINTTRSLSASYVRIKNKHTGRVLDADHGGNTNGTSIIMYPGNGGSNQEWYLRRVG